MMSESLNLFSDCKREFSFHGMAYKNEQKFIVCRKILILSPAYINGSGRIPRSPIFACLHKARDPGVEIRVPQDWRKLNALAIPPVTFEEGHSIRKPGEDITGKSVKQRLSAMWQFLYPPFPEAEDCTG